MNLAYPFQKTQDWLTQQWVIIRGKRIGAEEEAWLLGPSGEIGTIADDFIIELAKKENLTVNRNPSSKGLIPSIESLNLTEDNLKLLSPEVKDFYLNTSNYKLGFSVKWNPFFRLFGVLVNHLFSRRIKQLNIPTKDTIESEEVNSEIITLEDPKSGTVKHTIWFRTFKSTNQVIFSGVYSVCTLPSGKKCVKAVFPLPKGNATVILSPSVGKNGELILNSTGRKFGDPGFYFIVQDSKGNYWSRNHRSFSDQLVVSSVNNNLSAEHKQFLFNLKILRFNYDIKPK